MSTWSARAIVCSNVSVPSRLAQPNEKATGAERSAACRRRSATVAVREEFSPARTMRNSSPPKPDHWLVGPDFAHEEPRHALQHLVAARVSVPVVVQLEVIDVDEDAAPLLFTAGAEVFLEVEQVAPVVAPRQHVADQLFAEPVLEFLPSRDVDQDAVVRDLAGVRIANLVGRVEHRAPQSIGSHDHQLELAHVSFGREDLHLLLATSRDRQGVGARESAAGRSATRRRRSREMPRWRRGNGQRCR